MAAPESGVRECARQCERCGSDFHSRQPNAKFCGARCKLAAQNAKRIAAAYECEHCHQQFHPKRPERSRFCTRDCSFAHHKRKSVWPKNARLECSVWCVHCRQCGNPFTTRQTTPWCSVACRKAAAAAKSRTYSAAKKTLVERLCKNCGTAFVPQYGTKRRAFCSSTCLRRHGKRIGKAKRRARMRGAACEAVDPFAVFQRDRWRCQLCRRPAPRKLRGTCAPNAPELDHIVPLSRGGEHSYRNTQCACRACNQAKGDVPLGQLRLIA